MKIAIASDLSGFPLKAEITKHLVEQGYEVLDFGIESADKPQPYFVQAPKVARALQEGKAEKGILICGTGQGMAIVANKHKGIYACVVDSIFSAERAKIVNNANAITMGGWITAPLPRHPNCRCLAGNGFYPENGVQEGFSQQCIQPGTGH